MIKLGIAIPIIAIRPSDGSKNANLCAEQYDKLRDALLRSRDWNFAVKRFKLAQVTETPVFGFDFAYQLPADWLKTLLVSPTTSDASAVRYAIEAQTILSNASDIYLRYIARITDPNLMDALFREALSWRIAIDLAQPVTQSTTVMEAMQRGFDTSVSSADAQDAIEDYPPERPESSWVSVRM
ncbi:MAG TPA: hypothetical protein ENH89_17990 [Aurantimonas coralicida]|uniref:Uncharacterized protein n=1 Tax=Aurantimonas coralicida TaxID=182270 RepID=A0A9C9TIC7_9HYPH|nr:hypothetical protein [Aurantimonas coralicida]